MESQLLIYGTTGFDADDFTHETIVLSNDEFCNSYRVFKDDDAMLCVEFVLADSYIDLQNTESLELVKTHCNMYMDSFIGISYGQAKMSESIGYFLSSMVCGETTIIFANMQAKENVSGRCGTKSLRGLESLTENQRSVCATIARILKTDNAPFKFLLLYEKLIRMCGNKQANVEQYIRQSNTAFVESIEMIPCNKRTSDPRYQDKSETEITYLRNALGHPEEDRAEALNAYTNARLSKLTKAVIALIYEKAGVILRSVK